MDAILNWLTSTHELYGWFMVIIIVGLFPSGGK